MGRFRSTEETLDEDLAFGRSARRVFGIAGFRSKNAALHGRSDGQVDCRMGTVDSPAKQAMAKEMASANSEMSKANMRGACKHYMKAQQMSAK